MIVFLSCAQKGKNAVGKITKSFFNDLQATSHIFVKLAVLMKM